jgi:hypothetical protein
MNADKELLVPSLSGGTSSIAGFPGLFIRVYLRSSAVPFSSSFHRTLIVRRAEVTYWPPTSAWTARVTVQRYDGARKLTA